MISVKPGSAPQQRCINGRALRHGLPGHDAGAALVVYGDLAVDENVGNTGGVLNGIVIGRGVDDALGVEDRHAGQVALLQPTTLSQVKPAGGFIGQLFRDTSSGIFDAVCS
jgi:hypothetical protein